MSPTIERQISWTQVQPEDALNFMCREYEFCNTLEY